MSHVSGRCDLATLVSQQRFLRQQEQQVRAELLRISRERSRGLLPQNRPLSPPPPQRPIERRATYGAPYEAVRGNLRAEGLGVHYSNRVGLGAKSSQQGLSLEAWQPSRTSVSVAQRQNELLLQQQERQQRLLRAQRFMSRPAAPYGGALSHVITNIHDTSPYIFDSAGFTEALENFSRPQLGKTGLVDDLSVRRGGTWAQKRQLQRVSPQHLPAAGVPSSNRKGVEKWIENRAPRVSPHPQALRSSPYARSYNGMRQERSFDRQEEGYKRISRFVGASHYSAENGGATDVLPSTLPPTLHPETRSDFPSSSPVFQDVLVRQLRPTTDSAPSGGLAAGLPSLHRYGRGHTGNCVERDPPPWDREPEQGHVQKDHQHQQTEMRSSDQGPERREGNKEDHAVNRRQPSYTREMAAGKPSARNERECLEFCRSLRAEQKPGKSSCRPTTPVEHGGVAGGVSRNINNTSTRTLISDDEKTLRDLGVKLSPRELLFFRKQPPLREKQHKPSTRRFQSCKAAGLVKRTAAEPPERNSRLATEVWALPSWMKTYGLSDSSARCQQRLGATARRVFPTSVIFQEDQDNRPHANVEGHSGVARWSGQGASGCSACSCRCCRLRAAGRVGPRPEDYPCCCCPCCSSWGAGAAGAKHECARCGELSEVRGLPEAHRGLTLEEAASLCPACATYLACECKRDARPTPTTSCSCGGAASRDATTDEQFRGPDRVSGVTSPSRNSRGLRLTALGKPQKFCVSPANHRAAPSASRVSPTSGSPPQSDQVLPSMGGSPSSSSPNSQFALTNGVPSTHRQGSSPLSSKSQKRIVYAPGASVNPPLTLKRLARGQHSGAEAEKETKFKAMMPQSVWESPRIVSKICLFLSLSKLLLVRRCNRVFLQAAQFRMRYVLYKSLYIMLHQPAESSGEHPVVAEGHHCPISADALIKLLGLDNNEVDALKAGNLPPPCPPEALTPRMADVAVSIRKDKAALEEATKKKAHAKPTLSQEKPMFPKRSISLPEPHDTVQRKHQPRRKLSYHDSDEKQRVLLDAHMARWKASEEARLKAMMRADQQQYAYHLNRPSAFGYDEAAGPSAPLSHQRLPAQVNSFSREPATFRRVRHAFLKLWNYDDETFRLGLVRATSTPYPAWQFDVSVLLLRAAFQMCCNSLTAPSLKDLIALFAPKSRPTASAEVPCRADSYMWGKMARISGFTMHLVSDQTLSALRCSVVRLVAQQYMPQQALISGAGVSETAMQIAAEGGGVAPLILRPAVVDSLEMKMARVPPEFITEFVSYGKKQQLLHSQDHRRGSRGEFRQVKASQELVLLMDLYEWLASVLTHNQRADIELLTRGVPLQRAVLDNCKSKEPAGRPRTCPKVKTAKQLREFMHPPKGVLPSRISVGVSGACPQRFTSTGRTLRGAIAPSEAKTLFNLIEEQGKILREVCRLLRSVNSSGFRLGK